MVIWASRMSYAIAGILLAQQPARTPLERMDRETRAKVLAALAAMVILGLGMMALVWLGARVTRRYMNQEPLPRRGFDPDDWARKPDSPPEDEPDE